ncbi:MAG: hypothetical protein H7328_02855 [Bdellovibrio sp.]|nr:hypothetical protein [Bdellovibrio sp.]
MKKPKISFRVLGDSGPLSISWFAGPKGDAVESNNSIGVGFFSPDGELLAVEFDDLEQKKDHQILEFDRYQIEVEINNGKVSHKLKEVKKINRKKTRRATPADL